MKRVVNIAFAVFFGVGTLFAQPSQRLLNLIEATNLIAEREEDPLVRTIALFQSELENFNVVEQAIVHSMIAESLWAYLQQNRFEIFGRTPLANPDLTDVRTWDTRLLLEQTIQHYTASLEPREALQNLGVRDFSAILTLGDDESEIQRPTMFDLLAHRVINAFSQHDMRLTQPQDGLLLDDKIGKVYEHLFELHNQDEERNPNIAIPLLLQYLTWERTWHPSESSDTLYRNTFKFLLSIFPNHEVNAQIYWTLAEFHYERGNRHNNLISEDFRWDRKEALRYTESIRDLFPQSRFADAARAMAERIKMPRISLQMQEVVLPNQHNLFLLHGANLDTVHFSLYRISSAEAERWARDRQPIITELTRRSRTPDRQWQMIIPNPGDFQTHRVELPIEPLSVGYYVLFASTSEDISQDDIVLAAHFFGVSELSLFVNTVDEKLEGIVLNRRTGQAMRGVNIRVFSTEYDWRRQQTTTTELATLTSARNGRFEFSGNTNGRSIQVELQHRSDTLLALGSSHWWNQQAGQPETWRRQLFLFTDRAIYRPGQTVYFKGILVERSGDQSRIVTNETTTVRLFDANRREINSVEVRTNEYGSFSGRFVLPIRGLLGQFFLQNESGMSFFSVEEYRRPTFEIVFNPLESAYQLDQEAIVSGVVRTYAGANLGNSTVRYRVTRSVRFPVWRPVMQVRPPTEEIVISQGEASTDEDGRFKIWFMAYSDRRIPAAQNPTYTFRITIDATDISGETQRGVQSIPISHRALNLRLSTRPFMDKTQDSVLRITSTNFLGKNVPAQGILRIFRLLPDERLLRNRLWAEPNLFALSEEEFVRLFPNDPFSNENSREGRMRELFLEKEFNTETDSIVILEGLPWWESGDYFYFIEANDKFGNPAHYMSFFTIFSPRSERREPIERFFYTIVPRNTFEPGETMSFIVGSASRITVFYEIRGRDGVLERREITLNNEQRRIDFRIREEHRGNLSLQIWSVLDGRMYNTQETIFVPFTNRRINISLETFRDRLTPGEQENWTLRLLSNTGQPLQGELLLSMYDASLDVFRRNIWNMDLNRYFHAASAWQARNFRAQFSQQIKFSSIFSASVPVVQYDRLNFEPPFFHRGIMPFARGGGLRLATTAMADDNQAAVRAEAEPTFATDADVAQEDAVAMQQQAPQTAQTSMPATMRTNLNETAFFFPHLRSDTDGRITASFTVPESLTRWRIQALAHTQDLMIGLNEWSAVTQRELMIQPNVPRFLREGDVFKLQARIVNLLEEPLSGEANLGWSISNQFGPIVAQENWAKDFSVPALQNMSVAWAHRVRQTGFLNLNFSARAGNHTDGEARMIPILSNRAMLTETLPMFALPNSERTFSLPRLANPNSTTLENHRLTLQIATNPIWFAVQALPELSDPNANNSIALFGAFFANAMALDILQQNPEIQTVLNRWKMTDSDMLRSNLETNQELKSVLLEETPWLLQAQSETQRKHSIAMFFNENNVRNLQADVLSRLRNLQTANGGFAWNPGGRTNLWTTQYILQGLQRLHKRNIERDNPELQMILRNALRFTDEQHIERFSQTHPLTPASGGNRTPQITLTPNDIQFLYLRTYFAEQHPISTELATVLVVYDSLARASWRTQSRLLQGVLAQYFYLIGEHSLVQEIMQNFQRLALRSPELGMFWRSEPSWRWYESPIATQVQLIETFTTLGHTEDVEEMKRWLLSQKRTTIWNTRKASVEAVYALMLGTPNLSENTEVEIQIGNERITTPTIAEAGSGLFSKFWTADQIRPEQSEITIRNRGNSMVWGGLFWQYFENMDRVAPAETPLSVRKTLFVERMTDQGAILEEIPREGLVIGDVVVSRIEIRTDRNLDFVHLKSLRAATFEPMEVRSGYRVQDGLFYYQEVRDVSMNFYFTHLPRGTYVFEYRMVASQIGNFSNGFTTIQCLYAPEFSAQSEGQRVVVN